MRILYIIDGLETSLPRDQNTIINYMALKGHKITVITANHKYYSKFDQDFFKKVEVLRLPRIFKIRGATIFLFPFYKFLTRKYDIIHAFTFFTFSALVAPFVQGKSYFLRSELLDSKLITYNKSKKGIYRILIKFYQLFYRTITAYTLEEAMLLKKIGFREDQILILPPMIDPKNMSKNNYLKTDLLKIGTLSRITPVKGIHKLLEIIQNFEKRSDSPFRFLLAGPIVDSHYSEIVLSKLYLLGEKFEYVGEVSTPDIFYEQVDVVIVPSMLETGSIVTLEAMARGKIVMANNIYPMNSYIKNFVNGIIYDNATDAAEKLVKLLQDPELMKTLSMQAQRDAHTYYSTVVCKKLEDKYFKFVNRESRQLKK